MTADAAAVEQTYTGVVRARYETDLAFRVGAKITIRHVEVGQRVSAGTVLFRLDPTDYRLAVKAAESDLAAAEAEVVQATAEDARVTRLRGSGAVSTSEAEKTRSARDVAVGRRDRAKEGPPEDDRLNEVSSRRRHGSQRRGFGTTIEAAANGDARSPDGTCRASRG